MMVIFISQCEKKALKRTRRILDSFANRIGDNTWQTVITQEGLNAVQKLLRKTASKNSAVICHWIRSRSRSDFLWVVGKKDAFNESGVVPVHYGVVERFIGEKEIMLEKIYANTNGQRLDQHLFAVGYIAKKLIEKILPHDGALAQTVFIAGCWHDIGKIDEAFQQWIKLNKKFKDIPDDGEHIDKKTGKFSWEKYPRHNELSLLLFEFLFDNNSLNDDSIKRIKHAIYWHHAKPMRKTDFKKLIDIYNKLENFENEYKKVFDSLKGVFSSLEKIAENYEEDILKTFSFKKVNFDDIEELIEGVDLPVYKRYSAKEKIDAYSHNINFNAKNNLARTAIVTADRLISSLTAQELDAYIINQTLDNLLDNALFKERGLKVHLKACLDYFDKRYPESERNKVQNKVAIELADEEINIGVLNGSAGCGKTKIALEWALETNAKKIYWICPRVQVCEGIYTDLSSDEYLANANIEIVTGEIKKRRNKANEEETPEGELFSSDIVVTTIDQIINSITTHKDITTLMDFMNAHVIFDEYHEYITMQGFNLLFAELIEAKKMQQYEETLPNTLLVSATPNPIFIKDFLQINEDNIIGMQSFNNSAYKVEFVVVRDDNEVQNPLMQMQNENEVFVISNTAVMAQRSFIEYQHSENSILFHSKFTKNDKEFLFNEVFNSFKKDGNKKYNVLRSGPVVQASLNITCKKMISEMTHAENFLQRLGRLDRFGEYNESNIYTIAVTQGVIEGKSKDSTSRFLKELDSLQSAKAWYDFLHNNLEEKEYQINDFYKLYQKFYEDENVNRLIKEDLITAFKKSVDVIEKNILDPKSFPNSKKQDEGGVRIKKNSMRGSSLFVQMAKVKIEGITRYEVLDEYAWENIENSMTLEQNIIEGYGDSNKNLLAFMAKKHHNIKDVKKAYKDAQLINEARDPNTPVYLSYTLQDLQKVNEQPHNWAQYYAVCDKQPIGILSLQQLIKEK